MRLTNDTRFVLYCRTNGERTKMLPSLLPPPLLWLPARVTAHHQPTIDPWAQLLHGSPQGPHWSQSAPAFAGFHVRQRGIQKRRRTQVCTQLLCVQYYTTLPHPTYVNRLCMRQSPSVCGSLTRCMHMSACDSVTHIVTSIHGSLVAMVDSSNKGKLQIASCISFPSLSPFR